MEKEQLKMAVLAAAGIKVLRPAHCAVLSGLIYEKTGKQVSISKLKRVYGFTAEVNTSIYTWAALEEFLNVVS